MDGFSRSPRRAAEYRRPAVPVSVHRARPVGQGRQFNSIAPPTMVQPVRGPVQAPKSSRATIRVTIRLPQRLRRNARQLEGRYHRLDRWKRAAFVATVMALIGVILLNLPLPYLSGRWQSDAYALTAGDKQVITQPNNSMAADLKHDTAQQTYNFNADYKVTDPNNVTSGGGAKIQATLHDDLSKGVTITDPRSQVDFTMTPEIQALAGRQSQNQVQYPIYLGSGSMIYTANAIGVKEDVLLKHSIGDTARFQYKLGLGDSYAAKLLDDGSLAIYGSDNTALSTATASDAKDQALLQKAREHAPKTNWLFTIPPPVIRAAGDRVGKAQAKYSLSGDMLTVTATNLDSAAYPLSIDPTVQISTASEDVRNTSIESNADFDVTNNQITRGAISGGTTGTWTATATMNQARFLASATAYNGNMYVVGGAGTSASTTNIAGTNTNMVEVSSIGTGSPATLGTWAAGNHSGLPAGGLSRFQLIGYHGFLYAIGGSTTDTTCTTTSSTVYYASVQVNGVLGNWQTTNAPSTARCDFGAVAYGGKIYIAGGKTGAAANTGTADVSYAVVNPDGTLTWTNTVSVALPAARYGNDLQAYNGYLYVVGGCLSGSPCTLTNTVLYATLNSDGSIYGTGSGNWTSTSTFATARENLGAQFSVIRNGYIYLSGGCSALNANQSCTAPQSDTQLAQINADGSLGQWATTTSLVANRVGANETVWRGTIYNLAGCLAMATGTISCNAAPVATTQYGTVSSAGQASILKTASNSLATGLYGDAAVVMNGFLYVVGGCLTLNATNGCQTGTNDTTNATSFAQISATGDLGAWTTDTTHTINGASGVAETSLLAISGTLYALGGWTRGSAGDSNIWTVTPNPTTGALSASWVSNTTAMTSAQYGMSALYFNGNIYTFGGCIATTTTFGCSTYRAEVTKYSVNGTTIGAGSTTNLTQLTLATVNFPNAEMGLAFYYGYVYLCGGANSNATANGGPQTTKCVFNKLSSAGTMTGAWSTTTGSLNQTIRRGQAYASNGYLYVFAGHNGQTGLPVGDINIGQINPSTGQVASFSLSTTSFTPKWDTGSAFADGNIYTVGGCTTGSPPVGCTADTTGTQYFQIYNATNSGDRAVTTGTAYPTSGSCTSGCVGESAVAYNGYLYVSGGCSSYTVSSAACATAVTDSNYMALNPDGSMSGSWTAGPALPAARDFGCLVALNGTLYYIAGDNGGSGTSTVYFSTASGASWSGGSWTAVNGGSSIGKLLAARSGLSCTTWNSRIYATGGSTSTTVYYSPSLPSGGDITSNWTATTTTFTTGRIYHAAVAVGGYLYIIGGYNNSSSTFLSDVQYAQISSSGDITATWSFANDIPYKDRQISAFGANGYIYVLGGDTAASSTGCLANASGGATFVAAVDSDGTLGAWAQGVATSFTAVLSPALAYYNGYYYVIGGNNCTNNVSTSAFAGEQSQAIRSIFTRYIDLVGDATPWKFVVGGSDASVNSIDIDKWSMTYSSSRIATNAFGQPTTLSPLNFGPNPVAITAIDGSGTNQGVSRWWQLAFNIDQAASFTFADANTSLPAITSYSFYYAPSGNTRLRNGGIFQDQTSQSLDAHP